jgi:hypothetical protein
MRIFRPLLALTLALPAAASAQSLDLTIKNTGLSIGDSRFVRGVRLNFRDRNLDLVEGINATIWYPYDDARGGEVKGLALGLPTTGARRISGVGIGVFGVGTEEEFNGLGVGLLGVGTGGDAKGIFFGGLGVGAGGDVTGITFGGLGAGSGGNVKGVTVGLLGVGAGGDITGITFGGLGAGGGGNVKGITVGLLGAGAGGDITGITIGGLGAGAGGDITGFTLGVLGAGAGGTLRGITVAGLGAGAPYIRGIVLSAIAAGGHDVKGGVLAPLWFKIESDDDGRGDLGRVSGVTLSAFNQIKGEQFGLSLGLLNYAWELNGVQVGLINIAQRSKSGIKVLPLINW